MKAFIVLPTLMLYCSISHAQSPRTITFIRSGADLVDKCKMPADTMSHDTSWTYDIFMCAAYVEGVVEANEELGALKLCFPEKMNGMEFPTDIVNYGKRHPDR